MLDNDPEHSVGTALSVRLIDQGLSSLQRRLCTRVLLGDQTFIFSLNDTRKGTHCKRLEMCKRRATSELVRWHKLPILQKPHLRYALLHALQF